MEEAEECDRLVIMADGGVVAEGTVSEIVGDASVVAVDAVEWASAFEALERREMSVALVGRTLRVPCVEESDVRRALGDSSASIHVAPATLEERFLELSRSAAKP
jgi:ABC-2 type transport system ATP-binding protein/ribosome-dependent ATPase